MGRLFGRRNRSRRSKRDLGGGGICRIRHVSQLGNLDREGAHRPCSVADSERDRVANSDRESDADRVGDADCNPDHEPDAYVDDVAVADRDFDQRHADCDRNDLADRDRHNHADRDGYCDGNRHSYRDTNRDADAAIRPDEDSDQPPQFRQSESRLD